jgi:hypothetical protein
MSFAMLTFGQERTLVRGRIKMDSLRGSSLAWLLNQGKSRHFWELAVPLA